MPLERCTVAPQALPSQEGEPMSLPDKPRRPPTGCLLHSLFARASSGKDSWILRSTRILAGEPSLLPGDLQALSLDPSPGSHCSVSSDHVDPKELRPQDTLVVGAIPAGLCHPGPHPNTGPGHLGISQHRPSCMARRSGPTFQGHQPLKCVRKPLASRSPGKEGPYC